MKNHFNKIQCKQKGISSLVGIVVIVATAVVAVGGVFVYEYYSVSKTETPKIEALKNETVDWKTYKNNEYGFEIKYPKEWRELQKWRPLIDGIDGVILGERGEGDYVGINIDITTDNGEFVKKFTDELCAGVSFPNRVRSDEKIKIGIIDAIKVNTINPECHTIIIKKDNVVYMIVPNNDNVSEDLLIKIASTFKFIEE